MNRWVIFWVIFLGSLMQGALVGAQDLRPGIIGEDHRVIVADKGPPWDAIGQVNIGGYSNKGGCTGTLVAPNIAITAAHCVMNAWEQAPFLLGNIHFVAGVQGTQQKGHAVAKCLRFLEGYQYIPPERILPTMPAQQVPSGALVKDVVAILLDKNLPVTPAPLAEGIAPEPGLYLVHAAYAGDRRFMLSAHFGCHLLGSVKTFWFNDCDTHPGSSGGPVFAKIGGVLKLAAIMVASGSHRYNIT